MPPILGKSNWFMQMLPGISHKNIQSVLFGLVSFIMTPEFVGPGGSSRASQLWM